MACYNFSFEVVHEAMVHFSRVLPLEFDFVVLWALGDLAGDMNAFSSLKSSAPLILKASLCNYSGQTPGNHTRILSPCGSGVSPFFFLPV